MAAELWIVVLCIVILYSLYTEGRCSIVHNIFLFTIEDIY
jgi:hypothetical protein